MILYLFLIPAMIILVIALIIVILKLNKTLNKLLYEDMDKFIDYKEGLNWRGERVVKDRDGSIGKLVELLKEKEEREAQELRDKELIEYALNKEKEKKRMPAGSGIINSILDEDRKVKLNDPNLAIPYNLTELQKQVLEDFYGGKKLGS